METGTYLLDIPRHTTKGSFVLDRVLLEYTTKSDFPRYTVGTLENNINTQWFVCLQLSSPGVRDPNTTSPEFPTFQAAQVWVKLHFPRSYTDVYATFKVLVLQESDDQEDVIIKKDWPWDWYSIPKGDLLLLLYVTPVFKLIPSVKKIHINLSITWRADSIQTTMLPEFTREDPKYLVEKLKALQSSQLLSDVVFLVEGEEIRAHRQILGAMSEVFARMFLHDTLDKLTGCVRVEDATAAGFKRMLSWLYTCEEPEWTNDDDLVELIYLAIKYALEPLQAECSWRMVATLGENNLCKLLKVGSALKLDDVMDRAMNFIKTNKKALHSEEWQKLHKDHPDLETEILRMLVDNMCV